MSVAVSCWWWEAHWLMSTNPLSCIALRASSTVVHWSLGFSWWTRGGGGGCAASLLDKDCLSISSFLDSGIGVLEWVSPSLGLSWELAVCGAPVHEKRPLKPRDRLIACWWRDSCKYFYREIRKEKMYRQEREREWTEGVLTFTNSGPVVGLSNQPLLGYTAHKSAGTHQKKRFYNLPFSDLRCIHLQRFAGWLSEENRQGVPCGFVPTLHITTSGLSPTLLCTCILQNTRALSVFFRQPTGYLQSTVDCTSVLQ